VARTLPLEGAFANLSAPNDGVAARYIPQIPPESQAGHQVSQKSDLPAVRHHITALPVLAPAERKGARTLNMTSEQRVPLLRRKQARGRISAVGRPSFIHPLSRSGALFSGGTASLRS